jgi:formate hydrogenlyase transcriptional activator
MGTEAVVPAVSNANRYEAVIRVSEALSCCRDPHQLTRALAEELGQFLPVDQLDIAVFKENSGEIKRLGWGNSLVPFPEVPAEELPTWHIYDTEEPLHISDWNSDRRFPSLRQSLSTLGIKIGSCVRLPLTTPHRRLGTLGVASYSRDAYTTYDIIFLRLIARVVAFAIDDGINLKRAQAAQTELQRQNDRLQLLLNLTNRITSNLEPRELLRTIAANIREVIRCDLAGISLPDGDSDQYRLYAIDFPGGKGFLHEDLVTPKFGAGKQVLETLKPVIINHSTADELPHEVWDRVVAEGLKSHCLIPIVNRGRPLGILAVGRTTDGTFTPEDIEFLTQVSGQIAIAVENALAYQQISELKDKLAQEKLYLEEEIRSEMNFENIVGKSPALKHVLELVETVAPNDSTVLLLGETGTGKELIARAIHDRSRRKDRTFVKMNCAAIPTGLLESELFGHEKGAFTGAIAQKVGRLELADQGTLFLDEVGDIPIDIQPKLLRALQEREFERLGSTHTRKVNIRLVAATNRDLEKMIADREFRSDLYYRLNVFPIRIPPLRERKEDIPLLVSYFVQKFAKQMQKKIEAIPPTVMKGLVAWEWPGNIRELENFIERAVILTRGKSLEAPLGELRKSATDEAAQPKQPVPAAQEEIARIVKETISALDSRRTFADENAQKQREEIVHALTESKGRVGGPEGAAARLGLNRTTLLSRIKKFGINPLQYAQASQAHQRIWPSE